MSRPKNPVSRRCHLRTYRHVDFHIYTRSYSQYPLGYSPGVTENTPPDQCYGTQDQNAEKEIRSYRVVNKLPETA